MIRSLTLAEDEMAAQSVFDVVTNAVDEYMGHTDGGERSWYEKTFKEEIKNLRFIPEESAVLEDMYNSRGWIPGLWPGRSPTSQNRWLHSNSAHTSHILEAPSLKRPVSASNDENIAPQNVWNGHRCGQLGASKFPL